MKKASVLLVSSVLLAAFSFTLICPLTGHADIIIAGSLRYVIVNASAYQVEQSASMGSFDKYLYSYYGGDVYAGQNSNIASSQSALDVSGNFRTMIAGTSNAYSNLHVDFSIDGPAQYAFTLTDHSSGSASAYNLSLYSSTTATYYLSGALLPWTGTMEAGTYAFDFGTYNIGNVDITFSATTAVPIPGAVWLLASGLLGLIGIRRFGKSSGRCH